MTPAFAIFLAELRADPQFGPLADDFSEAFCDSFCDCEAVVWILSQPRTLLEKLSAILKLLNLPPGPQIVHMRKLTGWGTGLRPQPQGITLQ